MTSALVAVSQRRPVLVVIDDLHAADPASLRLLEFAARQTWFERLLLIGTYRDTEVEPVDHPLRDLLSPLVAKATTITLTGLDRAGVAALMARTAGHEPPPELVAEVHLRTGETRSSSSRPPGCGAAAARPAPSRPACATRCCAGCPCCRARWRSCCPPRRCWGGSSTARCSPPPSRPRSRTSIGCWSWPWWPGSW
ncbi:hypothetical protein ACFQQB_21440 [Nonomuraea rubra]|uniref:hypothetical protein n=1 Tax=Nonomuraea rubra TaxID=46180 RepID=UPI00360FE3FC